MNAETPISIMSRFESTARNDFETRLTRVRREMFALLAQAHRNPRFDVREVTREILGMKSQERYDLLRHVLADNDGGKTLEGMEALRSFIANSLLDDSPCTVKMDPEPSNLDDDVSFSTTLSFLKIDYPGKPEAELREEALAIYRGRERPLVLLFAGDDDKVAGPDDILKAIASNRELERKWLAAYEDMECEEVSSPAP